jgi:hypothetical protein
LLTAGVEKAGAPSQSNDARQSKTRRTIAREKGFAPTFGGNSKTDVTPY